MRDLTEPRGNPFFSVGNHAAFLPTLSVSPHSTDRSTTSVLKDVLRMLSLIFHLFHDLIVRPAHQTVLAHVMYNFPRHHRTVSASPQRLTPALAKLGMPFELRIQCLCLPPLLGWACPPRCHPRGGWTCPGQARPRGLSLGMPAHMILPAHNFLVSSGHAHRTTL